MKSKKLGPAQVNAQMLLQDMDPAVKQSAEEMLRSPSLMKQIADDAEALGIVGERTLVQQLYLIGISRLLDDPLSGRIHGPSASGKSFANFTMGEMIPSAPAHGPSSSTARRAQPCNCPANPA
jgi:hypothetical protein